MRVHEWAKGMGVASGTLLWFLRLIRIHAKSPSSKVTLEYIEQDVVWEHLLAHKHEPLTASIVPVGDTDTLTAKCICTAVLRSRGDDEWKARA
jgi:hypothetical protein